MDGATQFLAYLFTLPFAIGTWLAVLPYLKARRLRAAERAPLPSDVCVACGAHEVDAVAPQVVRCRACGFVGGEGMSALQRQRRLQRVQALTSDQRRALAIGNLREAQWILISAAEGLDAAVKESRVDLAGFSFDRGEEKLNSFGAALRNMRTAHLLACEAAEAIQASAELTTPLAFEQGASLYALDTAWLTDGFCVDLAVHVQIRKARGQLQALQQSVEGLLQYVRSRDAGRVGKK